METGKNHDQKEMNHGLELVEFARDLAKYGDVTVGFALAQALFLAYALGKNDDLTRSILKARVFVKNAVCIGNGAYALAVLFFGFEELRFRSAAHQSPPARRRQPQW